MFVPLRVAPIASWLLVLRLRLLALDLRGPLRIYLDLVAAPLARGGRGTRYSVSRLAFICCQLGYMVS